MQKKIISLFSLPLFTLIEQAHHVLCENFPKNTIQLSTLLNIKSGGCPENCAYCPQSVHYKGGSTGYPLLSCEEVKEKALQAKARGATRFCMGAAWRSPPKALFSRVLEMIRIVKDLEMETCMTLGMLTEEQAQELKEAGLDYYNHNLDTSPRYYEKIITTRKYEDRKKTLFHVSEAGINVCCGGILGMGETREDRIAFLQELLSLPQAPQSIPLNHLVPIPGTPLADQEPLDSFEFIRTLAVARILFPSSMLRLTAGRYMMSHEMQALCFYAGANSVHYGDEVLLKTPNPHFDQDQALFSRLGLTAQTEEEMRCKTYSNV